MSPKSKAKTKANAAGIGRATVTIDRKSFRAQHAASLRSRAGSIGGLVRPDVYLQDGLVRRRPASVETVAEAAAADSLPFGWETATSRTSGRTYYVNRITGERTFRHPDEAQPPALRMDAPDHGAQPAAGENLALGSAFLSAGKPDAGEVQPRRFRVKQSTVHVGTEFRENCPRMASKNLLISGPSASPSSSSRGPQAAAKPADLIDLVEERETDADKGKDANVQAEARQVAERRPKQQVVDGRRGGRLAYTPAEDEAMRRFVAEHPHMPPQGQHIWKDAEQARLTRHGWASMHNRWRRTLCKAVPPARRAQDVASAGGAAAVAGARSATVAASTASGKRKAPEDLQATSAAQLAAARVDRLARLGVTLQSAAPPKPLDADEVREPVTREEGGRRGGQEVKADSFDGRWFCGAQAYTVRGSTVTFDGEDPALAGTYELRRLSPKSCEFFMISDDFEETLTGCLTDDGQRIWWEDSCFWTRTEGIQQECQVDGHMHDAKADVTIATSSLMRENVSINLMETFSRKRARRLTVKRDAIRGTSHESSMRLGCSADKDFDIEPRLHEQYMKRRFTF